MIIYNKYNVRKGNEYIPLQVVKAKRLPLTKENKLFLKTLKLRLKNND